MAGFLILYKFIILFNLTKYEVKIIIFKEIKFRVIPKTRNGTNGNGTEKNRAKTRKRNFRTRNN